MEPQLLKLSKLSGPKEILANLHESLCQKEFVQSHILISEYIMTVQELVEILRPILLEKFPLPAEKNSPKCPALVAIKETENGSDENKISFVFNGEKLQILLFSTGTAPTSCIDNFPLEVILNGKSISCKFPFGGIETNSEAVFASEKVKREEKPVSFFRGIFGPVPFLETKPPTQLVYSTDVVLSLDKMSAKTAPRKLVCKEGFFGTNGIWDTELRVWVMIKAMLLKFEYNAVLREILLKATSDPDCILGEIQANEDPWTVLATDDSVGLLGAVASVVSLLIRTSTSFEEICPKEILEKLKY